MIPHRFAPYLFGFILSGLMSFMVSGISTFLAFGMIDGFFLSWMSAWLPSWCVAFPTVLVVAPIARKLVAALTTAP